jgi:hypothetical protein
VQIITPISIKNAATNVCTLVKAFTTAAPLELAWPLR